MNKKGEFVFYVIEKRSIRKFLVVDMLIGSALYYGTFIIYHHIGVSMVSSMIGTTGIRRFIWKG